MRKAPGALARVFPLEKKVDRLIISVILAGP